MFTLILCILENLGYYINLNLYYISLFLDWYEGLLCATNF